MAAKLASAKQVAYIESLAGKLGKDIYLGNLGVSAASKMIDALKAEIAAQKPAGSKAHCWHCQEMVEPSDLAAGGAHAQLIAREELIEAILLLEAKVGHYWGVDENLDEDLMIRAEVLGGDAADIAAKHGEGTAEVFLRQERYIVELLLKAARDGADAYAVRELRDELHSHELAAEAVANDADGWVHAYA